MSDLPGDWQRSSSTAIEGYRHLPEAGVLQIVYRQGRQAYDFPCTRAMYEAFVAAGSKGRYVERVLRPYARARGWSRPPRRLG